MKLRRTQSHRDRLGQCERYRWGSRLPTCALRQLANHADHVEGQMAHIMADSSDSRFPCATAKERAEGRGGGGGRAGW